MKNSRPHYDIMIAWAKGKAIQEYIEESDSWVDIHDNCVPIWNNNTKYRIKPCDELTYGIDYYKLHYFIDYCIDISSFVPIYESGFRRLAECRNIFESVIQACKCAKLITLALFNNNPADNPPKLNECFYCVKQDGSICEIEWENSYTHKLLFRRGNCFKTEEDCKSAAKQIKEIFKKVKEINN